MDSCLPLLWGNWCPLKSSAVIMLPIFLTPLKMLILGCCNQACHQTLHPPPLLPFQRVVGVSQLLLDLFLVCSGIPLDCLWPTVVPVQQLLGFTMTTWKSSYFLKKASSSGSDGLWQVLMTVSFGLASHPDLFTLYWPVNHFSAELHTFRLFLCIEWVPVTFPVCPSCGACNHPSHYSRHVSCSTMSVTPQWIHEFIVLLLCKFPDSSLC